MTVLAPGHLLRIVSVVLGGVVLAGCATTADQPPPEVPGGDPRRGQELITTYGCSSCHVVPGVRQADGQVGPPLTGLAERSYLAGMLPNDGENLQRWIRDPQAVVPGNAMPDLGVDEKDARDLAAYLFTLR